MKEKAIATDSMGIKKLLKEYYEQFCAHIFENLYEMNKLLQRYNLSKLTQGKADNLRRSISTKELESAVNLPKTSARLFGW